MLRAVAASLPNAHSMQAYWRGVKDLGLTMEFMQKGGTEFACISTSAKQEIAVNFAMSALPLIFKFETKDFAARGADISFLSVRNPAFPLKTSKASLSLVRLLFHLLANHFFYLSCAFARSDRV